MCECDECSPRCTAKAVSIIQIIFSCGAIFILSAYISIATGSALKLDSPKYNDTESDKRVYAYVQSIRATGAAVYIILFLLHLVAVGLDILLYLACSKERVVSDRKLCFIWVIIWLVVSIAGLICGFVMGGMMSNHGVHGGHAFPVLHILLVALVIPYVVQLSRSGSVIVQPAQINPSQMQNPNMYNPNPSVGGYPQSQIVVVGYLPQQGYPLQGGYPQLVGYPQLQQPMPTPSQQPVAQPQPS